MPHEHKYFRQGTIINQVMIWYNNRADDTGHFNNKYAYAVCILKNFLLDMSFKLLYYIEKANSKKVYLKHLFENKKINATNISNICGNKTRTFFISV